MVEGLGSIAAAVVWLEGNAARKDGVPRDPNPHKRSPTLAAAWTAGWDGIELQDETPPQP